MCPCGWCAEISKIPARQPNLTLSALRVPQKISTDMNKINRSLLSAFIALLSTAQLSAQQFFFSSELPATCGSSDGIVTIVPTRGVPPFSYLWSNGATTLSLRNAPKGNYAATLTDATGATVAHSYILNSKEFDLKLSNSLPASFCNPNSGLLAIDPLGGAAPFTFAWSDGQTGPTAQNLTLGTYSVTVLDASGCSAAGEYKVGPTHIQYYPITEIKVDDEPDCVNTANGALQAVLHQSGYLPYNYQWSNGATSQSISNLQTGTYSVTVTDALGCTSAKQLDLRKEMTMTGSVVCTGSNAGTASALLVNASAPVTYTWSNGQSGPNLANLPGNYYTVTATDANGCSSIGSTRVTIPSLNLLDQSPKCYTGNSGSAYCYVNNDLASSFQWDNGETDAWATALSPGTHTVTVATALGCVLNGSLNIPAPLGAPVAIASAPTAANCINNQGGAMNLSVSGGFPPYFYSVYGPNGFVTSDLNSLQNLKAGDYYVYVNSAANFCSASANVTIPETNGFEPKLVVDNIDCVTGVGSAAIIDVNMPGVSYSWAHGPSTPALFNLTEGLYSVTVTGAGSCLKYFQFYMYQDDSLQVNGCAAGVSGQLVNDLGATGCAGTAGIPYQVIRAQPSGALNFTDAAGLFTVNLPTGTFDLELPQYDPADIACPATGKHTVHVVSGSNIFGMDFHFLSGSNTDHRLRQRPLRTAQPGYPYSLRLEVCNDGLTSNPGTLDIDYGNFLGTVTAKHFAQHPGAFVLNSELAGTPNNSAQFGFPAISPGNCELLQLDLATPTGTPLNTEFVSNAEVSPSSGDPTPANNISKLFSTVVGAFDPNVVLAYPARNGNPKDGGEIIRYEDNSIVYQIFFQNTGNAPADLVVVKDTIDSHLNLASIRNITASHNMKVSTEEGNNVLVFRFDNINLPDSTSDYAGSIGSIQYEIDLKPGLDLGTEIDKSAAIFFDFNPPVITNRNTLELVSASRVRQPRMGSTLTVLPNPADAFLGVYCDEPGALKMYSALGALISTQQVGAGLKQLDTAELPSGVYLLSLESGKVVRSGKVVVQH